MVSYDRINHIRDFINYWVNTAKNYGSINYNIG